MHSVLLTLLYNHCTRKDSKTNKQKNSIDVFFRNLIMQPYNDLKVYLIRGKISNGKFYYKENHAYFGFF